MRIVLAGATGVIGIRLLPLLIADGHQVLALTRRDAMLRTLRELGADPLVCDVYDAAALREAVMTYDPDLVIHQLTDLADEAAKIDAAANARIRTEGTANLLAAAIAAGVPGMLAQSVAWDGGPAVVEHERVVLEHGGVVVRYGQLYGPDTYFPDSVPDQPRIQIDEAARRTVPLLTAPSGVVTLVEP